MVIGGQRIGSINAPFADGRLNYRPEAIPEAFYKLQLHQRAWRLLDLQRFANPAYNADRGPVAVWGLRLHSEF